MKGAIYYGPGDTRIEEVQRPTAGDDGLVLRVRTSGICPLMDIPRYKKEVCPFIVPGIRSETASNGDSKPLKLSSSGSADKFVTDVFPLEKIKEPFEKAMNSNESTKVLVEP